MEKLIDAFVGVIMLIVGVMVMAVMAGADPSTTTSLVSSIIEFVVYVFIISLFGAIVIVLATQGR